MGVRASRSRRALTVVAGERAQAAAPRVALLLVVHVQADGERRAALRPRRVRRTRRGWALTGTKSPNMTSSWQAMLATCKVALGRRLEREANRVHRILLDQTVVDLDELLKLIIISKQKSILTVLGE